MRLGLVAGCGSLPALVLSRFPDAVVARIATRGNKSEDRFFITDLARVIRYFRSCEIDTVVITGDVYRAAWRPSLMLVRLALRLIFMKNRLDGILRLVIAQFEKAGMRVVGIQDLLPDILVPEGLLTTAKPGKKDLVHIERNLPIARAFAATDRGQSMILRDGLPVAFESLSGTDRLIASTMGDILVKIAKPGQDLRADIPVVGPATVEALAKGGYKGMVLQAGRTIFADPTATMKAADKAGIFILGVE